MEAETDVRLMVDAHLGKNDGRKLAGVNNYSRHCS